MDERNYRMQSDSEVRGDGGRIGRLFGRNPQDAGRVGRAEEPRPAGAYGSYAGGASAYTGGSGVVINSPKTYEDVQLLIDHLKLREQVIVDFSTVNQASVYRILDFMSGAVYALGGSIQRITKNIFLFAPAGVTITIPPQFSRR